MRTPRLALLAPLALALACSSSEDAAPRASLAGKVVLAGVDDASGVVVTLAGPEARAAVTDASGAYAFAGLPDGEYVVVASARSTLEGTLGQAVTVSGGGELAAPDLAFTAVGSVAGRVTLGGAAAGNAGTVVAIAGGSATGVTDDAGDYRLERVPVGTHLVVATRSGYLSGSAPAQPVRYAATTEVPALALAAGDAAGTLAGVATLAGAPFHGGTTVTLAGTSRSATTAEDGSWSLEGIADGIYTLELVNGEYTERIPGVVSLAGGSGFVADGELHPLGAIELARARRLFSGELGGTILLREKEKLPAGGGWAPTPDGARIVALVAGELVSAPISGDGVAKLARDVVSFRIAPDGAAVLYRTYAGTLEAVPPAGGAPVVLGAGVTGDPSFSPDGSRACFTTRTSSGTLGHLADYEGGVTPLGSLTTWTWAGGGGWALAWDWNARTLTSAPVAGGAAATLASGVHAWTEAPGGAAAILVMTDQDAASGTGTLSLVPLAGGDGAVLATDAEWSFTWSDDAAKLAFTRRGAANARHVQVSAVADGTTLLSAADAHSPSFSPGSRHVLYVTTSGALQAAPAAGGEPVTLSTAPWGSPQLSPDGDVALVTDSAGGTYTARVVRLETGATLSSYDGPPGYAVQAYGFSPDSSRAYAYHPTSTGRETVVSLPASEGAPVVLSADARWYGSYVRFTPDGAFLVFPAQEGATVTLRSASVATDAVVDLGVPWGPYSISPGSSRVLFQSGAGYQSVPVAGGPVEVLASAASYQVSPDGSTLAFLSDEKTTRTLVTAPAEGGGPTVVAADVAAYAFAGDRLVFTTRSGALRVSPFSGPAVEIAPVVRTYDVTADAAGLVYVDAAGDLGAVALATGAVTQLATAVDVLDYYSPFAISPSGARVAFARSGVVSTAPLVGGPVTPHVRSRPGTFSWLGDGHLVVVRSGAPAPYGFQNGLYVSTVP